MGEKKEKKRRREESSDSESRERKKERKRGGDKESKKEARKREKESSKKERKREKESKKERKHARDAPRGADEPPRRLFPADATLDAPPPGGFAVTPLEPSDYFVKNHEFAAWLQTVKRVYFTSLQADEARRIFLEFCALWNARRLPRRLYDGVTLSGRR